MNSTVTIPETPNTVSFPKLFALIEGDAEPKVIVLFKDHTTGTVVYSNKGIYQLGSYANNWVNCLSPAFWKPYDGIVELKN